MPNKKCLQLYMDTFNYLEQTDVYLDLFGGRVLPWIIKALEVNYSSVSIPIYDLVLSVDDRALIERFCLAMGRAYLPGYREVVCDIFQMLLVSTHDKPAGSCVVNSFHKHFYADKLPYLKKLCLWYNIPIPAHNFVVRNDRGILGFQVKDGMAYLF